MTRYLTQAGERLPKQIRDQSRTWRQLSLFDDFHVTVPPAVEDGIMALTGQI